MKAIYTRVSTDEQANGFGLGVQSERCERDGIELQVILMTGYLARKTKTRERG
jgi:hypothetical protein